jgi:uncharacterized protein YeaO (DUF488 family)
VAAKYRTKRPVSQRREYASPACFAHEFEDQNEPGRFGPVRVKRVYDDPEPEDGARLLVDRLWPRGLRKDRAALDEWLRDLAPSDELRIWFHCDTTQWAEFRRRYRAELKKLTSQIQKVRDRAANGPVTLLYASRDSERNHARLLKEVIEAR